MHDGQRRRPSCCRLLTQPQSALTHPSYPLRPTRQADGAGNTITGVVPATNAAAQFSMEWMDINPALLSQLDVNRYVTAIQAKMPPGAIGGPGGGEGEGQGCAAR